MKKILKNKYIWVFVIFLILLSLLFGPFLKKNKDNNLVTNAVFYITLPFQKITYNISYSVNNWVKETFYRSDLKQKNSKLQAEINDLRKKLTDYNKYKLQNQEMMKLLNVTDSSSSLKLKSGLVIGKISNDPFKSFIIDKGKNDDIKPFDSVITPEGFVGYVAEVNLSTSVVKTILDNNISIGVYNINNGESGIVSGSTELAYKNKTKMQYLSNKTTTKSEDILVTSGIGDKFPKMILVGKIMKIKREQGSTSYFGLVEPFCDFDNLKHIFIVTSFSNSDIELGDFNDVNSNNKLGNSALNIGISKPVEIK